ncbi:transcription factor SFL1 [Acrasis kona]|uniref:Transcription factor SFL1 n=1 Tax=Acrasis kona TaxID=1008807 RepID=A0AAW2YZP3_9EUKA
MGQAVVVPSTEKFEHLKALHFSEVHKLEDQARKSVHEWSKHRQLLESNICEQQKHIESLKREKNNAQEEFKHQKHVLECKQCELENQINMFQQQVFNCNNENRRLKKELKNQELDSKKVLEIVQNKAFEVQEGLQLQVQQGKLQETKYLEQLQEKENKIRNLLSIGSGAEAKTFDSDDTNIITVVEELGYLIDENIDVFNELFVEGEEQQFEARVYTILNRTLYVDVWKIVERKCSKESVVDSVVGNRKSVEERENAAIVLYEGLMQELKEVGDMTQNAITNVDNRVMKVCESAVHLACLLETQEPKMKLMWSNVPVEYNPEKHIDMYGVTSRKKTMGRIFEARIDPGVWKCYQNEGKT